MPEEYYLNNLYPFQNEILAIINQLGVDFYLSGGTALSRCYLNHRYSDDLDFFVNDNPRFKQQCQAVVHRIKAYAPVCNISVATDTFVRVFLEKEELSLKVDFINDVPFHSGSFEQIAPFGKVDNWRNILSNKICALSRMEPKDYADILFIANKYPFNWENIISEAKEKDLWVEPIEVSKLVKEFPPDLLMPLKWQTPPDLKRIKVSLSQLHEDIFLGKENSLYVRKTS